MQNLSAMLPQEKGCKCEWTRHPKYPLSQVLVKQCQMHKVRKAESHQKHLLRQFKAD